MSVLASANTPKDSTGAVKEDTVVVYIEDGIPWNRENFNPERLKRDESFDPGLRVAYSYSVNFISGSFGTFAHQTYMAHLAYDFSPDLHLYANLGLWMPLYTHFKQGVPIPKEDVRQGRVDFIMPDITLEYKPTENTRFRLMLVNERDAMRAYGPRRYYGGACAPWRNSIFCD